MVHLIKEDPEEVEFRCPSSKKERKGENFSFEGPLNVVSLEGHEKLVGIKIGFSHWLCMDVLTFIPERSYFCASATRTQILWLLEISIRTDCGTETGKMTTIQT